MGYKKRYITIIVLIAIGALVLRLGSLEVRPLHADESVHGFKFCELLDNNNYKYDPFEFHGPTLNYSTLVIAKVMGIDNSDLLKDRHLRLTTVVYGVLLVLMVLLVGKGIGWPGAIVAGLLTAICPAMVYYSRYYIQEMLLVCFCFGAIGFGWRLVRSGKLVWAVGCGISLGLMHATKETFVIPLACMAGALIGSWWFGRKDKQDFKWKPGAVWIIIGLWFLVAGLFFTSFGKNPGGIADSFKTYTHWFGRTGSDNMHVHGFGYFWQILFWGKYSLSAIGLLALVGVWAAFNKKVVCDCRLDIGLIRFVAIYSLLLALAYSVIPYKTPWCMLGFLHGFILLAGIGFGTLWQLRRFKLLAAIVMVLGIGHMAYQIYLAEYKYPTGPSNKNPYAYAHTCGDVKDIVKAVRQAKGKDFMIEVIVPDHYHWPLGWYLRDMEVGYYAEVPYNVKAADMIIADVGLQDEIINKIMAMRVPGLTETKYLRPDLPMQIYMTVEAREKINE
ncbi:MAG: TIGR03663 family protein [Phycisphaerae bacterium]|nr:TIGR03663 family protein [Phycisphaerae bacterium]